MNEFLFWCRHPLVPLLFHEVTSLHPPSFQRNDFSTCVEEVCYWEGPLSKVPLYSFIGYWRAGASQPNGTNGPIIIIIL